MAQKSKLKPTTVKIEEETLRLIDAHAKANGSVLLVFRGKLMAEGAKALGITK
jgi:hypothetical protein